MKLTCEKLATCDDLRKIHGLVLRMLCPKRRSTPVAGMEMMAYIPPLEVFLKGEAVKAYVRNKPVLSDQWKHWRKNKYKAHGHLQANEELCRQYKVPDLKWDREAARLWFNNCFTIDDSSYEKGDTPIR